MQNSNYVDAFLITLGTGFGIAEIETILGIVLLVFDIIWILSKCIVKVYSAIKEKKYHDIPDTIKETRDELENLKDGDNHDFE